MLVCFLPLKAPFQSAKSRALLVSCINFLVAKCFCGALSVAECSPFFVAFFPERNLLAMDSS